MKKYIIATINDGRLMKYYGSYPSKKEARKDIKRIFKIIKKENRFTNKFYIFREY